MHDHEKPITMLRRSFINTVDYSHGIIEAEDSGGVFVATWSGLLNNIEEYGLTEGLFINKNGTWHLVMLYENNCKSCSI